MNIYIKQLMYRSATFIFVVFISCHVLGQELVAELNIEEYRKNVKEPLLSEVAEDTWFIKLETSPDCLIGRVRSLTFFNSKVLVLTSNENVFLFENSGVFITKIGKKGRGPGEYVQIFDYAINPFNSHISILDNGRRKIIEYSEEGQFIIETDAMPETTSIEYIDSALIHFSPSCFVNLTNGHHLHKLNANDGTFMDWHKRNAEKTAVYVTEQFYNYNSELIYWQMQWDTVYCFNGDTYYPKYYLNMGKDRLPEKFITGDPRGYKITDRDGYYNVSSFDEYSSIIIAPFIDYDRRACLLIYHKQDDFGYSISWHKEYRKLGFRDDIAGIPIFNPKFRLSDSQVGMVHEVLDLIEYMDNGSFEQEMKDSNRRNELLEIIHSSKISDNPIIQIANLK